MVDGLPGLRDANLLQSALSRPRHSHAYGEQDLFRLAALYAEAICRNHPFVDGNKRVGFAAADLFLYRNGYDLQPTLSDEHADMIIAMASSKIDAVTLADYFKKHSLPLQQSTGEDDPTP
ncbi:MAG: type II toxin-antitoxin system death-on-curing family toxin [Pseudomonadota bacterium]